MEKSTANLSFLNIVIKKKTGTEISLNIYNKPVDSKRYVLFTSNHLQSYLKNMAFNWLDTSALLLKKKTRN